MYHTLLRSELDLPAHMPYSLNEPCWASKQYLPQSPSWWESTASLGSYKHRQNLLSFSSTRHSMTRWGRNLSARTLATSRSVNLEPRSSLYSLSPLKYGSQQLLLAPRRSSRNVSKWPYRILEAPGLADDFYLNLVDWDINGVAFGLVSCVYVYDCEGGDSRKVCDLGDDLVTSVRWLNKVNNPSLAPNSKLRSYL